MNDDSIEQLRHLATFSHGAYVASDNAAFKMISAELTDIVNRVESPELSAADTMPIDDLSLAIRTINVLKAENINTVKELLNHSERQLKQIPNLGLRCFKDIKQTLDSIGLTLRKI